MPIADSPDRPGAGLQGVGSQLIDGEGEGAVEHIAGPERVDRLDRKHRHFADRLSLAPQYRQWSVADRDERIGELRHPPRPRRPWQLATRIDQIMIAGQRWRC